MNSFIRKLGSEGKIVLTEPGINVAESYLKRSEESLRSAKHLAGIGNYNDAIALTYYSMYYCALSLLYRCGIKSENHSGTIYLLKEVFNIDTTDISKAKSERIDKQYYIDFAATAKDVESGIITAESFNANIRMFIEKIRSTEISGYNNRAKKLLS